MLVINRRLPFAPIALDLGRTDSLSTQTPIDVGIELVIVRK
jgi:hypothetical protein